MTGVVARILSWARSITELRRGRIQPAAILFADVRGFTATSESLSPIDVAMLLNTFRDRAAQAIEQQRGIVDKFISDGVMGVFCLPEPGKADARATLSAAQDLFGSTRRRSAERSREGHPPIRVAIGVHELH